MNTAPPTASPITNTGKKNTNCTRGLLYYFTAATGDVLSSFDLWRGKSGVLGIGARDLLPRGLELARVRA